MPGGPERAEGSGRETRSARSPCQASIRRLDALRAMSRSLPEDDREGPRRATSSQSVDRRRVRSLVVLLDGVARPGARWSAFSCLADRSIRTESVASWRDQELAQRRLRASRSLAETPRRDAGRSRRRRPRATTMPEPVSPCFRPFRRERSLPSVVFGTAGELGIAAIGVDFRACEVVMTNLLRVPKVDETALRGSSLHSQCARDRVEQHNLRSHGQFAGTSRDSSVGSNGTRRFRAPAVEVGNRPSYRKFVPRTTTSGSLSVHALRPD